METSIKKVSDPKRGNVYPLIFNGSTLKRGDATRPDRGDIVEKVVGLVAPTPTGVKQELPRVKPAAGRAEPVDRSTKTNHAG